MDAPTESYVLLLLADSNLPTGSFVASSGLESYVAHGFFGTQAIALITKPSSAQLAADGTIDFLRDSLHSYSHSALPFVSDAHDAATKYLDDSNDNAIIDEELKSLRDLDALYESMTLNHVARRASRAQGVALLTLYVRGFTRPASATASDEPMSKRDVRAAQLIDAFKLAVRKEDTPGHLPICWAILTAALGLTKARSQYLHLFLQARGILSAAVRLNTLGPYAAQQLLRHSVKPIVDKATGQCAHLRTELTRESEFDEVECGPATTWPLGEILAARHDLQHSKIFNS